MCNVVLRVCCKSDVCEDDLPRDPSAHGWSQNEGGSVRLPIGCEGSADDDLQEDELPVVPEGFQVLLRRGGRAPA